jgi:hypothetical protein
LILEKKRRDGIVDASCVSFSADISLSASFQSGREPIESFVASRDFQKNPERKPVCLKAFSHHSCFSGYRSMNTKLVLSALVAALMLSACAKQEAAAPAAEPPATEAPAAPAADAAPPADAATPPADAAAAPADAAAAPAPAEPPKQ